MSRGAKLRQLRSMHRLKQQDVAQKLGTTQAEISRYEIGKSHPRIDLLDRWCAIFGITVKELEEMRPIHRGMEQGPFTIPATMNG